MVWAGFSLMGIMEFMVHFRGVFFFHLGWDDISCGVLFFRVGSKGIYWLGKGNG